MSKQTVKEDEVRIGILITSDIRNEKTDISGKIIASELEKAGYRVVGREFCPNDAGKIEKKLREMVRECDAVIVSGGTGIGKRDVSADVCIKLMEKELPGFGEIFRAKSYEKIGHFALLSRATGGVYEKTLIFCIPGSPDAAKTACEILIPLIKHAVHEVKYR